MSSLPIGAVTRRLVHLIYGHHWPEWSKLTNIIEFERASESVKARILSDFSKLKLEVKLPVFKIALDYSDPSFISAIAKQLHPFDICYFTAPLHQTHFFSSSSKHVHAFAKMLDAHFDSLDLHHISITKEIDRWIEHFHRQMSEVFLDNSWYYFWKNDLAVDDYSIRILADIFDKHVRDVNTGLRTVSLIAKATSGQSYQLRMSLGGKEILGDEAIRNGLVARLARVPQGESPEEPLELELYRRALDIDLWRPEPPQPTESASVY